MFDLNYFKKYINQKNIFIAGCDEVGRGPLAGPVVASCVLLHQKQYNEEEFLQILHWLRLLGVSDSKKLTHVKREEIVNKLELNLMSDQVLNLKFSKNAEIRICIQETSVDKIDEINILNASLLAMRNAFLKLFKKNTKGTLLIDGNKTFLTGETIVVAVVKGDTKSTLIGLASIVAKVYRDRLMTKLGEQFPGYFWEKNAGYGTAKHIEAIKKLGITSIHRKSFKGVKEFYEDGGLK